MRPTPLRLLSIGHSDQPMEQFLALLEQQAVEVVADVRSRPHSKYAPQFSAPAVERAIVGAGLDYLFLGRELGGRPADAELYDQRGRVLYGRLARSPLFLAGLERLLACADGRRVVVMCSEESPLACHRRLLIGRVLAGHGVQLDHLRRDGRVQTEAELAALESGGRTVYKQASFLEEAEDAAWTSTRSVSPAERPPSSSVRSDPPA